MLPKELVSLNVRLSVVCCQSERTDGVTLEISRATLLEVMDSRVSIFGKGNNAATRMLAERVKAGLLARVILRTSPLN